LGGELQWCEQIPELTMTAYYDRDSNVPSGGDQGKIGIKIERVNKFRFSSSEVVRQPRAGLMCAAADKAATQIEFCNVARFPEKSSSMLQTA
jgi:hypothetical protein